jgi:hypothetical protein
MGFPIPAQGFPMSAESTVSNEPALSPLAPPRPVAEVALWAAVCLVGLLGSAALLLCWRRLSAGLARPLAPAGLVGAGATVAALAAIGRIAWRYGRTSRPADWLDRAVAGATTGAVLALGAAVSLPDSSLVGLVVLWGVLAVEEVWAWSRSPTAGSGTRFRRPARPRGPAPRANVQDAGRGEPPGAAALDRPPQQDVLQQLTRSRTPDGAETLSGWLRVPLAPGQRSTSVHVAFCPPFDRTPEATLVQIDGPDARIKTVQLLPYGARFDLKLAAAGQSEGRSVLLQLEARCRPRSGAGVHVT